jgi:hypothetical protein
MKTFIDSVLGNKALVEFVFGKEDVLPNTDIATSRDPKIADATSRLREKLAEKRLQEEKRASQYGNTEAA